MLYVRGFVLYSDPALLILQDGDSGMALLASGKTAEAGQAAVARCLRTPRGFTLREITAQEPAEAPQPLETTLAQAPEHRLLALSGLVYQDGAVSQAESSLLLAGQLPAALDPGDVLDAKAVRHGQGLYLLQWQKRQPEQPQKLWYPMPEDAEGPRCILTVTDSQGQPFALCHGDGVSALPIVLEEGLARCPEGNTEWDITRKKDKLIIQCPRGWLSCQAAGIFLSSAPDSWEISEGYLYHPATGQYLVVQGQAFAAAADHQAEFAGQQLGFWRDAPAEPSKPERPEFPGGLRPYFGQLHAHSQTADGQPLHQVYASARDAGLDFFAVTDPSKCIGSSAQLARGRKAAQQCGEDGFVALYGCEMTTFPGEKLGHISTLGCSSLPQWEISDLPSYYEALAGLPGSVSQFNHPGAFWGEFAAFSPYDQRWDQALQLLEVCGEDASWSRHYYDLALEKGWHIAPSNNQNDHTALFSPEFSGRTVALAAELTEQALLDAIRARRVYASEDADLSLYYSVNGQPLGSVLAPAESYTLELLVEDPTDGSRATVELIGQGEVLATYSLTEGTLGISLPKGLKYCYLQLTQDDGDRALTAPVWMASFENMGIQSFTGPETAAVDIPAQLTLTLYNQTETPMEVNGVTLNDQIVPELPLPLTVAAGETRELALSYTCREPGAVSLTAVVQGSAGGLAQRWEMSLTLPCPGAPGEGLPEAVTALAQVRAGTEGTLYRVRGYVTAGTDNPYNRFPEQLYLQDDTGGIVVTAFPDAGIAVGTPLEVVGVRKHDGENPALELLEYQVLPQSSYRYVPKTMHCSAAMNAAVHGGRLVQVEGKVQQLHLTQDGKGIRWLEVADIRGEKARILIEPYIRAGSTGENDLAKDIRLGRTVRAMGLCHLDENGECVLRVRNCEEVVYVPPLPDPSNPKTGDLGANILHWLQG